MASNPYVNKVEFGNSVLLDLTSDTATADKVLNGYTFHLASGASATGTAVSGEVEWKDVNFLDYDGTVLFSYTLAEAQALTALPTPPAKSRLTFTEWTMTLAQVNAVTHSEVITTALYSTNSGCTEYDITLSQPTEVSISNGGSYTSGMYIDWGDGSRTTPTEAASPYTHQYASDGSYTIQFYKQGKINAISPNGIVDEMFVASDVSELTSGINPYGIYAYSMPSKSDYPFARNYVFNNTLIRHAYYTNTNGYPQQFPGCRNVKTVELAQNGSVNYNRVFNGGAGSIEHISFGAGGYLDTNVFNPCYNLRELVLPANITGLESNVFASCYSLRKITFYSQTPPTILNSNVFSGLPTTCLILVPNGTLSAYTSATNYPSSSTYTYEEY